MHLRLIVMIAKITKTFHMQKGIFVWLKIQNALCQSCIQRPALQGLSSIMCFSGGFLFLGYFLFFSLIFMRFVLLVLCNIFTGSFLWTLHMKWMKNLGFALWISLSKMSSGSGNIPRNQNAIKQISISTLVLAACCSTPLWYLKDPCISLLCILKGCVISVSGDLEEEGKTLTRTKTTKYFYDWIPCFKWQLSASLSSRLLCFATAVRDIICL